MHDTRRGLCTASNIAVRLDKSDQGEGWEAHVPRFVCLKPAPPPAYLIKGEVASTSASTLLQLLVWTQDSSRTIHLVPIFCLGNLVDTPI